MTTGRINQVANPLFVASWQNPRRGSYQPAAELQRSAVPWRGARTWTVSSERDEGLGSFPFLATAAFRWWCWGREVPSHTPGA